MRICTNVQRDQRAGQTLHMTDKVKWAVRQCFSGERRLPCPRKAKGFLWNRERASVPGVRGTR